LARRGYINTVCKPQLKADHGASKPQKKSATLSSAPSSPSGEARTRLPRATYTGRRPVVCLCPKAPDPAQFLSDCHKTIRPAQLAMALATRSSAALLRRLALSRPATLCRAHISPTRAAPYARRSYSIHADHAAPTLQELNASKLTITRTTNPKPILPPEDLVFGKTFTGRSSELPGP
jgi:hypothetical protein